jgi:membrane protein
MKLTDLPSLLKQTWTEFNDDKAPRLGAALAFYTVFSLAPMLVIAVAIVGFFTQDPQARLDVIRQVTAVIGPQGGEAIASLLENTRQAGSGLLPTIISIVTLLFGASGVFGELQGALNTIWGVQPKPDQGLSGIIKARVFALSLVVATGFLLLVSLVLTAVLQVLGAFLATSLPGGDLLWQVLNFAISFAIITFLFAAIFKVVPDVDVQWRDVWIGAAVTALLFVIGRWALSTFLINGATVSVYGAAGSFVAILLWVYYSAQILFLGAEFTQVYAYRFGTKIVPSDHAVYIDDDEPVTEASPAAPAQVDRGPSGATPTGAVAMQGSGRKLFTGFFAGLVVGIVGLRKLLKDTRER